MWFYHFYYYYRMVLNNTVSLQSTRRNGCGYANTIWLKRDIIWMCCFSCIKVLATIPCKRPSINDVRTKSSLLSKGTNYFWTNIGIIFGQKHQNLSITCVFFIVYRTVQHFMVLCKNITKFSAKENETHQTIGCCEIARAVRRKEIYFILNLKKSLLAFIDPIPELFTKLANLW